MATKKADTATVVKDKATADKRINELLAEARASLTEAEQLADQWQTSFSWDLAYGMGGWYEPKKTIEPRIQLAVDFLNGGKVTEEQLKVMGYSEDDIALISDVRDGNWYPSDEGGWKSSSSSC